MTRKLTTTLLLILLVGCESQNDGKTTTVQLKDGNTLHLASALVSANTQPGKLGSTKVNRLRYSSNASTAAKEIDGKLSALGYTGKSLNDPRGLRVHYTKPKAATIRTLLVEADKAGKKTTRATLYWTE